MDLMCFLVPIGSVRGANQSAVRLQSMLFASHCMGSVAAQMNEMKNKESSHIKWKLNRDNESRFTTAAL